MSRSQPNRSSSYQKTHLTRHGRGWKYARSIPVELRALEGRKTTYVKSLGPVAYETAQREARRLDDLYDARIQRLRNLSPAAREEILAIDHLPTQSAVDAFLVRVKLDADFEFIDEAAHQLAKEFLAKPDDEDPEEIQAQQLLEFHKIDKEREKGLKKLHRKRSLANEIAGTNEHRLTALISLWTQVNKPRSAKTIDKAELYVDRFVGVCGDLAPTSVTRRHALQFMQALQQKKLSPGTINLHLEKLHTLFNVGLSEQKFGIQNNPFSKIRVRVGGVFPSERKEPFSSEQIKTIFENCEPGSEFELVTRVLAFHGCRSSEVCQLTIADLQEMHGVLVLRIHRRNGDVKNASAVRDVPVHNKCKTELLAQQRRVLQSKAGKNSVAPDGQIWLFPKTVCLRPKAQKGHDFQLRFGRLLRKIGITDKAVSLHSLRHSFRDFCREVEMPEDISRALMGHSLGKGDHGATYGRGVSVKKRSEWLNKIDPAPIRKKKSFRK